MGAGDVIGIDLQLRLGVDLGAVGKDQSVMTHAGVGAVGALRHHDTALEHRPRLAAHRALGQLAGGSVDAGMGDGGGQVGVGAAVQQIEAVQPQIRAAAGVVHTRFTSLTLGAARQHRLGEGGMGGELDAGLADRDGVRGFVDDDDPLKPGALAQMDVEADVSHIGRARAFIAFQQQQVRAGLQGKGPGRAMSGCVRRRDEAKGDRFSLARFNGQGVSAAQTTSVEEDDLIGGQIRKRPRLQACGVAWRRGRRQNADQAAQIRPAPVFVPAAGQFGEIAGGERAGEAHAASRAYLS